MSSQLKSSQLKSLTVHPCLIHQRTYRLQVQLISLAGLRQSGVTVSVTKEHLSETASMLHKRFNLQVEHPALKWASKLFLLRSVYLFNANCFKILPVSFVITDPQPN